MDALITKAVAVLLGAITLWVNGWVGVQFRKNRRLGVVRDDTIRGLMATNAHMGERLSDLTREIDRDRTETRFVQEQVRSLQDQLRRFETELFGRLRSQDIKELAEEVITQSGRKLK